MCLYFLGGNAVQYSSPCSGTVRLQRFREDTGRFQRWKVAQDRSDLEVPPDSWAKEVALFSSNHCFNECIRRKENRMDIPL